CMFRDRDNCALVLVWLCSLGTSVTLVRSSLPRKLQITSVAPSRDRRAPAPPSFQRGCPPIAPWSFGSAFLFFMSSPNIRLDEVGYQKRTSGASGLTKLYNSRGPPVNTRSGLCVAQITHAITLVDDAVSPCYALHCHQFLVIIH